MDVVGEVVAGVVGVNHENPVLTEAVATERKLTWNRLSLSRTHLATSREMNLLTGLQVGDHRSERHTVRIAKAWATRPLTVVRRTRRPRLTFARASS